METDTNQGDNMNNESSCTVANIETTTAFGRPACMDPTRAKVSSHHTLCATLDGWACVTAEIIAKREKEYRRGW
jgi:hypothetical protein